MLSLAMAPSGGFLSGLTTKNFRAKDIKLIYFGNYLRDMSQAIDVGTLSKGLDAKTIALLVWVGVRIGVPGPSVGGGASSEGGVVGSGSASTPGEGVGSAAPGSGRAISTGRR